MSDSWKKTEGTKYDKMSIYQKQIANKRIAPQYGIDLSEYSNQNRPGAGGVEKKSWDDLGRDIATAMSNDYDVRRTMELAKETGNKKAAKLPDGLVTGTDAHMVHKFMHKTHKNRMDSGGAYDGANDQAGVMNYWKDKSASQRNSALEDQFGQQEIKTPEASTVDTTPKELSGRAQAAMENPLGEYSFSPEKRGLGGDNNLAYDPNAGVKSDKAGAFLGEYKLDIQKGIGKNGTPGRGPNSIHNKF